MSTKIRFTRPYIGAILRDGPSVGLRTNDGLAATGRPQHEGSSMKTTTLSSGRSLRVGAVIAVAALSLLVPASGAQTPVADAESHPAHIHSGSCDSLGDVVHPLTNV